MVRHPLTFAVVVGVAIVGLLSISHARPSPPQSVAACRHDQFAAQSDRVRREQALAFAKALNTAEGTLAQQTRRYHPLAALPKLPPMPAGFELSFYSGDAGYIFSIKDKLDPCRYAIFSDEAGFIYEKSARTAPIMDVIVPR